LAAPWTLFDFEDFDVDPALCTGWQVVLDNQDAGILRLTDVPVPKTDGSIPARLVGGLSSLA
jgi:hypothetical protein